MLFQSGQPERDEALQARNRSIANEQPDGSYDQWKAKEEIFHLKQAVLRSKIRIEGGREKPIDILARVILVIEGKLPIPAEFLTEDYRRPYNTLQKLSVQQLQELLGEIETYQNVDRGNQDFQEFWKAAKALCEIELDKKQRQAVRSSLQTTSFLSKDNDDKLCQDDELEQEAEEMLNGKPQEELLELQEEVEQNISSDKSFAMDMQYWQNLLRKIKIQVAKTTIEDIYSKYVSENNDTIQKEVKIALLKKQQEQKKKQESQKTFQHPSTVEAEKDECLSEEEAKEDETSDLEKQQKIMEQQKYLAEKRRLEIEAMRKLTPAERIQKSSLNSGVRFDLSNPKDYDVSAQALMEEIRRRGLGADEQEFTDIVSTATTEEAIYDWKDMYKPRKPKFFNSIQSGFEWNKYNQTHYDEDNPPPKIVQGYKFNIFYPDLVDKTKAPQFYLEQGDTPDTLVIRFHAGPPYEDIAYKILNREWEMSERHGFKNVFDRGILQLHFNFKKHRYRR